MPLISAAESANAAVLAIYSHLKMHAPTLSLVAFGRKIGIKQRQDKKVSKLVNDIFRKRRKISMEYIENFCRAFDLHPNETLCLKLLTQRDLARGARARKEAQETFDFIAHKLPIKSGKSRSTSNDDSFDYNVMAAFGMGNSAGEVTEKSLIRFFGQQQKQKIRASLQRLEKNGAIVKRSEFYKLDRPTAIDSNIQFNIDRMAECCRKMEESFFKPKESFFLSATACLKMSDLQDFLEQYRQMTFEILSRFDRAKGGDMLCSIDLAVISVFRQD